MTNLVTARWIGAACIVAACLLLGLTVPRGHAHKCVLWSEQAGMAQAVPAADGKQP